MCSVNVRSDKLKTTKGSGVGFPKNAKGDFTDDLFVMLKDGKQNNKDITMKREKTTIV
jgi:hypothetical protein